MNYINLFRSTLPETALEIAALLVLFVDLGFLRKAARATRIAVAAVLGIAGCLAALWAVSIAGPFSAGNDLLLSAGGSAGVAQVAVLALTALTLLLLIDSDFTRNPGEYVAVVLMAAAGGLLISAAQDLLVIFAGLELLSLSLYILTAFAKQSGKSAESAIKYYVFGAMSAAFLLFGFSYLYGLTGSTNLHEIALAAAVGRAASATPLLYIALVMVAVGLGFKVAAVPFHLWAPDTYEGAPAPAAAFIASVSKVASFALLVGIGTAFFHVFDNLHRGVLFVRFGFPTRYLGLLAPWELILTVLAVASMIFGNLAALAQSSVRRLLAYSAIAHAGYILLGLAFFSWTNVSAQAVLYYIVTHGLTTIGAFGVVGVVERAVGSDRLEAFLGLQKRNPLLAAVMLVLFLSLAGIPPLVGFWAKFNLFAAVLRTSGGALPFTLVALAVLFSAVSLYYYLQVLKRVYVMPATDESPITARPVTVAVLVLITAAVVVLGCFPALLQSWIASFYPHP
ncbi:NADH-quinone oxidoreductase subunit N 2 [Candidatus Sulfotelmatomonas gaucii]|uniref:NADH-quinone oxidoreductase subunit N n=1 Tax=Candidatus Sulfuritelmatomonas gaucii TaxID=2043161 RepID=A0A2N9LFI0_9BACT|nr:NADH-quinone oxidoreductase subunit N 2 [Candidatus Sulfotelmatomonas gaucii]